jgi:Flp pilus assembly protein protease CpaA
VFLLWLGFWVISFPIIVRDLNSKLIPNIYLKLIAVLTGVFLVISGTGPTLNLIFAFIVLSIFMIMDVGMGDIKLLALAFMIFNSQMKFSLISYLIILLGCAFSHICLEIIGTRRLPERIALAPSIFLAFALYFQAG